MRLDVSGVRIDGDIEDDAASAGGVERAGGDVVEELLSSVIGTEGRDSEDVEADGVTVGCTGLTGFR